MFKHGLLLLLHLVLLLFVCPAIAQDDMVDELIERVQQLQDEENYEEAIILLNSAIEQYVLTSSIGEASNARIYHKIGVIQYFADDFPNALSNASKAIEIRTKALGIGHPDLANSYFLRGSIYNFIGQVSHGLDDLKAAIRTYENNQTLPSSTVDSMLALQYIEAGLISHDIGDHFSALLFWQKAYRHYDQKYEQKHAQLGYILNLQANVYRSLGEFEKALGNYEKALSIYGRLADVSKEDYAVLFNNLALVLHEIGRYREAEDYFLRALCLNQEIDKLTDVCNQYSNLISVYEALGAWTEADRVFEKGIQLSKSIYVSGFDPILAELYRKKGSLEVAKGNLDEALMFFQKAIAAVVPGFKSNDNSENPSPSQDVISKKQELLKVLHEKAKTLTRSARSDANPTYFKHALKTYQVLDTLIAYQRQSFMVAESKFNLNASLIIIYEEALTVALDLYEKTNNKNYLETAYAMAAQNKAIVMLEDLKNLEAKGLAGIPKEVVQQEKALSDEYYEEERKMYQLYQEGDEQSVAEKKEALFRVRRQYDDLIERLEKSYPEYYQLKYAPVHARALSDLQKELPGATAIVEFFIGQQHIFVFTILSDELRYQIIDKPEQFESWCKQFRALSTAFDFTPAQKADFAEKGHWLYELLLKSSLEQLGAQVDRLIFIPDHELLSVSFDLLLYEPATAQRLHEMPFLIKKYALSTVYSNRLIFGGSNKKKAGRDNKAFLGFGLEYDDYTLEGLELLDISNENEELSLAMREVGKLTYADDEVLEVAQLLNGQAWVNEEATKQHFLQSAEKASILHLAMHGVVDVARPMHSALIFSRTSDSLDYLLYASEIYNLKLPNTEMVVLSACNTGFGALKRGEGIRSLARAFAYAGSPSLVASMWNAPDQSTKDILLQFYQNLQDGLPKDRALQLAKLDYLEKVAPMNRLPAFWSHLVVVGDLEPIYSNVSKSWRFRGLLLGLLVGGLLFFIKRRQARG